MASLGIIFFGASLLITLDLLKRDPALLDGKPPSLQRSSRLRRVISTGPYAIVRHPMYASASLYLIGTPLALGSYWGLLALAAILPFLIGSLLDEERLLANELLGFREYRKKVRFRLVPGVW